MKNVANLSTGWLGDLPQAFVERLVAIGRWVRKDQGQIIYGIGSDDTNLYGIASGTARMQMAINEHEQRLSHVIGPGFWFGENELVSGEARMLEFAAATGMSLLQITRTDFQNLARDVPDAWRWIALLAGQHLITAIGAADDLMLPSSEKRLAAVLLRLSGNRLGHPRSPSIAVIPVTQQELAIAANLSRASAGRILRKLETSGEISLEYRAVMIRDFNALSARIL
jgi:CRP-like cAMP-binding protein